MESVTVGIDPNRGRTDFRVVGHSAVTFFTGDRRWIDVRHFVCPDARSDSELLALLIGHPQFRDGYMGGGWWRGGPNHGRYAADAITPQDYLGVSQTDALRWVDDFCGLYGDALPPALDRDITAVLRHPVAQADAVYRLGDLKDAEHEFAWILREFRELVLIQRDPVSVSIAVMGID